MAKKLVISFGISILLGIAVGFLTSQEKYYYYSPGSQKHEITFDTYKMYFDKTHNWQADYTKFTKKEDVYNNEKAILFGLATFGFLCIILNLRKDK
jgi:hypothetical protein